MSTSGRFLFGFVFTVICSVATLSGAAIYQFESEVGDYIGQPPPGKVPQIFAPGIISTEANELNCAFTPDLNEVYFTVWREGVNTIMVVRRGEDGWTERRVAEFSGQFSDVDPFITSNGQRLYFSSKRPVETGGPPKDSDLWFVARTADQRWGPPVPVTGLNSPGKDEYYTSISMDGSLYLSIFESHGEPGDIFVADSKDGNYETVRRIGFSVSTEFNDHDPYVNRDGRFLIFTSDRPDGLGRGDLYISFREGDGWTTPRNMGALINTEGYEFCPLMSPDGRYLFFTRNSGGQGDIYWVDARIIEEFE